MGAYCELHTVGKPDAGELHIARAEGDGGGQLYLAACARSDGRGNLED